MNQNWIPRIRYCYGLVTLGAIGLICVGLTFQYIFGLEPCALCISQRVGIIATGLVTLIAFVHNPKRLGQQVYGVLAIITASLGASISIRHIYIQSLPADQQPLCGPGISYLFETRPFLEGLNVLLKGDGNCGDILVRFLGLTIPGWTLVAFTGCIIFLGWQIVRAHKS